MVEIGRVDIIMEVLKKASHMASPWEGHLNALMHIFGFLRINHSSRMVYDPSYPTIDINVFKPNNWKNVEESIPSNAPEPHGKEVDLILYVNSNHAGGKRTRRSRTGFFVFMNTALMQWFCTRAVVLEATGHNRNLSFWR